MLEALASQEQSFVSPVLREAIRSLGMGCAGPNQGQRDYRRRWNAAATAAERAGPHLSKRSSQNMEAGDATCRVMAFNGRADGAKLTLLAAGDRRRRDRTKMRTNSKFRAGAYHARERARFRVFTWRTAQQA